MWAQILCYKNQGIHWYHCNPTFLWKINFTLVRRLISALLWDISGLWNRSDGRDFREKLIDMSRFLTPYIYISKFYSTLENGSSNHSGSDVSSPLTSPQELSDPNSRAVTIRVNPGGTGLDSLNRRPNNLSLSRKSSSSKEPLYATIGSKRSLPSASARLADVWRIRARPQPTGEKRTLFKVCDVKTWTLCHIIVTNIGIFCYYYHDYW